jgi:hypothetical protein
MLRAAGSRQFSGDAPALDLHPSFGEPDALSASSARGPFAAKVRMVTITISPNAVVERLPLGVTGEAIQRRLGATG